MPRYLVTLAMLGRAFFMRSSPNTSGLRLGRRVVYAWWRLARGGTRVARGAAEARDEADARGSCVSKAY
jgi:hypothetical protein